MARRAKGQQKTKSKHQSRNFITKIYSKNLLKLLMYEPTNLWTSLFHKRWGQGNANLVLASSICRLEFFVRRWAVDGGDGCTEQLEIYGELAAVMGEVVEGMGLSCGLYQRDV